MKKMCTKCGEVKPLDEYYRQARCNDGRQSECKECHKAHVREVRHAADRLLNKALKRLSEIDPTFDLEVFRNEP